MFSPTMSPWGWGRRSVLSKAFSNAVSCLGVVVTVDGDLGDQAVELGVGSAGAGLMGLWVRLLLGCLEAVEDEWWALADDSALESC